MSATGSASARLRRLGPIALLVLGPGLWLTHLLLSYWFVPVMCRAGSVAPMHILTAVTATGAVAAATAARWLARRTRRPALRDLVVATSADPGVADVPPRPRIAILEAAATLAAYFAVVIVVTGVVALIGDPCG